MSLACWTHCEPLCLFLDDLQWGDEATFEWIDFACRHLHDAPILWIGAYRSEEETTLDSLLHHRAQWYPTGRFQEFRLGPLSRAEVEELVRRSQFDKSGQNGLTEKIWKRSEGLALLVVEEIRAHREGRQDTPAGEALIADRLARLAPEDREILSCAAVIGERFSPGPLAAALEQKELEVVRRLDALRRRLALLEEDGSGFRFAHSRYREALLTEMSQALRQSYHNRLMRQSEQLSPVERTYHLTHGGDVEQGVEALLAEGDRTLRLTDWRDARRYYVEALRLAQESGDPAPLFLDIFQRLGDLQWTLGQYVIAQTYYEAARCWAHTPREKVLLLCRLAESRRAFTSHKRAYLDEAVELLPQVADPAVRDWVQFQRLTDDIWQLKDEDLARILALSRRIKIIPGLPREYFGWPGTWLLREAALRNDRGEIERQTGLLETLPAHSWAAADQHLRLAGALQNTGGDLVSILGHLRAARRAFESLGRVPQLLTACGSELSVLRDFGAIEEARGQLRDVEPGSLHEKLFQHLCETWIHDRSPEGVEWATRFLRGAMAWSRQFPTDGGHLGTRLHELGVAERIFRETGRQEEFRRQVDAYQEALAETGFQTDAIWYFTDPVELPQASPVTDLEKWDRKISDQSHATLQQDELVLQFPSFQLYSDQHAPRVTRKVSGDFVLQATFHGGADLLEDILQCRRLKAAGKIAPRVHGSGSLCALRDRSNRLTLQVHTFYPSQVLFEFVEEGGRKSLGRGLLGDGPARLRLERKGDRLRAHAGNEDGDWYCCGEVELPGWQELEVGVYGDLSLQELNHSTAREVETRCRDIRLDHAVSRPRTHSDSDSLYPLPEPTYAPNLPHFVTADAKMRLLLERVRQTANSSLPLLIQGATGTGKELIARAVHQFGDRERRPFVPLNCAALSTNLLESELFGHVRGTFTGAYDSRAGLFEVAHGGILFLDEIGDASPELQARLLRVLEEQTVRRVGEERQRPVDVRIVAATNRDLRQAVSEGRFRRDLYYRLQGLELLLPPLCQRQDDIPHLVSHALGLWSRRKQVSVPAITRDAMETLLVYEWPGNVRELLHAVERAAEEAGERPISLAHLSIQSPESPSSADPSPQDEYRQIVAALRAEGGNVTISARRLGIHRNTLYRKMRRLGIDPAAEKA